MNEIAFEKLDEQAEILENEIKLSLQELEELNKQQAEIGTPDGLGKTLMNTVWEQFELQLAVQAGEDFIKGNKWQTLDLSDDAHIQTTENFEKGKIEAIDIIRTALLFSDDHIRQPSAISFCR